jgi:SET domain-containing protein
MLPSSYLVVQTSLLPGAGKGLFTLVNIPRGTQIIEYIGHITTWAAVKEDYDNPYIYYFNSKHVIDALPHADALARYANDAAGMSRMPGISNNCFFKKEGKRVFIQARRNIPAGSEILVNYGKGYWDTAIENLRIDEEQTRKANRGKKTEKEALLEMY